MKVKKKTIKREKNRYSADEILKSFYNQIKTDNITCSNFKKNIGLLQELIKCSEKEAEILETALRMEFSEYKDLFSHFEISLADIVKAPRNMIWDACSKFSEIGFCTPSRGYRNRDFGFDMDTPLSSILYNLEFDTAEDLKKYLAGNKIEANLEWDDFKYIGNNIEIAADILKNACKKNIRGVNLIFYGEPGTGKTEFTKTLAKKCGIDLYKIENIQCERNGRWDTEFSNRDNRYPELILKQNLLKNDKNICLMFDEAEEIFRETTKISINRTMESNPKPIIWIFNRIGTMDRAYLRRFTYAIKFEKPETTATERMWKKELIKNHLPADKKTIKRYSKKYSISPSFIASAAKTATLTKNKKCIIEKVLDSMQILYNHGVELPELKKEEKITIFNPELLNTDTNMIKLAENLKKLKHRNFSLCLYGVSGTGKSAFAEYLAKKMKLPVIKKKCSDLLNCFVGGTEHNIAKAFAEAKEKKALLIFDEADSFLQDRRNAMRSWETTQVNEMLTQMENADFPFVCTTNLMENLDKAALRRFTFKVQYNYMTEEQRTKCFYHFFKIADINLSHLPSLTPGDFVVVKKKAEILGCLKDKNELVKMLEAEQKNKSPVSHKIGF